MTLDGRKSFDQLAEVCERKYPLTLTKDEADALAECLRRVLLAVPEEDRFYVGDDYNLARSALCHPEPV